MPSNKHLFWETITDPNTYQSFQLLDQRRALNLLDELNRNDKRLSESWKIVDVTFFRGDDGIDEHKPLGDFVDFIGPAVSVKARSILEPLISNTVEFLPLKADTGVYFAMKVHWVDCLDVENSKVKGFDDGAIMRVIEYAFHWDRLEDIHIFHLPKLCGSSLFVSDKFKEVVEKNKLEGLIFYPIPIIYRPKT